MAEKTLETLLKERAATDRAIAAKHLAAGQSFLDRLSQPDVAALAEAVQAAIPSLNSTSQHHAQNLLTCLTGVPPLIAEQNQVLTEASAEPVTPP